MVQSLEMMRLLGVDRVVIYKSSCSPETQRVLDYYTKKGGVWCLFVIVLSLLTAQHWQLQKKYFIHSSVFHFCPLSIIVLTACAKQPSALFPALSFCSQEDLKDVCDLTVWGWKAIKEFSLRHNWSSELSYEFSQVEKRFTFWLRIIMNEFGV